MKCRRILRAASVGAAGLLSMVARSPKPRLNRPPHAPDDLVGGHSEFRCHRRSSLLSWSTAYAQRCKASGAWSGRRPTQGTYATGSLKTTQTYTLQCVGPGGTTIGQGDRAGRLSAESDADLHGITAERGERRELDVDVEYYQRDELYRVGIVDRD